MTIEAATDSSAGSVTGPDGTHALTGDIDGDKSTWSDEITSPMNLNGGSGQARYLRQGQVMATRA
jgi:hypothetical protein